MSRVAIITGSSAGIGFAIAKTLARNGLSVVINGRTFEKLKSAENEIGIHNPSCRLLELSEVLPANHTNYH